MQRQNKVPALPHAASIIMNESRLKQITLRLIMLAFVAWGRCGIPCLAGETPTATPTEEPWLHDRLEWFQDQKFGFMMHFGVYSQWGCIESWPLVEEDKWARPDDLKAWSERGKDMQRFTRDYW